VDSLVSALVGNVCFGEELVFHEQRREFSVKIWLLLEQSWVYVPLLAGVSFGVSFAVAELFAVVFAVVFDCELCFLLQIGRWSFPISDL